MESTELFVLPIPPPEEFNSADEVLNYCNTFAARNGYAVSTKSSNQARNIYIKCDFGGQYRPTRQNNSLTIRLNTSSRLRSCPFLIYSRSYADGKWRFQIKNSNHNHGPTPAVVHPIHRRLNEDQKNEALDLLKVGVKPKNVILRLMNQEDGQNLTSRAVYNLKQKSRHEYLNDLSSLQKLLQELDGDDWVQHYTVDENNAVNAIFFAQKWSINLCRRFNKAIVMDCTYQTNK